jgi:hypothetical protein
MVVALPEDERITAISGYTNPGFAVGGLRRL